MSTHVLIVCFYLCRAMMAQLPQMLPHLLSVVVAETLLWFESLVALPVEAAMMNVSTLMDSAHGT